MRRTVSLILGAVIVGSLAQAQGCINDGRSELGGGDEEGGNQGTGGDGGANFLTGGHDEGGAGGTIENPCGTECSDEELCTEGSLGLDDDCDGEVDEGCSCASGLTQGCFMGDPSYRNSDGCFPGTQHCSELGTWGPCTGGVHATELCFEGHTGCHAISSVPFVTADLGEGTGDFSMDAITEVFEVACPSGVDPCPAVQNGSEYSPLQSGEYTVTYTKTTASGDETCTYPLFIGAPGLRVELTWEHPDPDPAGGVDVDLHLHQPNNTAPWGGSSGNAVDCAYSNCTANACINGYCPTWFNGAAPPDPVRWYEDPILERNTCYFGPRGTGQTWTNHGQGCHNPRLDSDNVGCDPTITDPQSTQFCNPENINVDFPPDSEWTRIGVHYFSSSGATYDVHPVVKIFCNGKLAAELGEQGYFDPSAPVTFKPSEGTGDRRFWMVADVAFVDGCGDQMCVVRPLYLNEQAKTPHFVKESQAESSFGPAYPPPPGN